MAVTGGVEAGLVRFVEELAMAGLAAVRQASKADATNHRRVAEFMVVADGFIRESMQKLSAG